MNDKKHARLSPSASHRWMHCPGSINLSAQVPPPPGSDYAIEGTAAHAVAEHCLKNARSTCDFLLGSRAPIDGPENVMVDEDMISAVNIYLNHVRGLMKPLGRSLAVETKFDLTFLGFECFGTNDAMVFDEHNKVLHIVDYKHGQGVEVEAEWNTQLMIYAIGAIHALETDSVPHVKPLRKDIEHVVLTIVQPRLMFSDEVIKTWEISKKDLLYWRDNVLVPAAMETSKETAKLFVGDHCRFCPALAVCPEQVRNAMAIAETDFNDPVLPPPEKMTPEQIVKVLQVSDVFSTWAAGVKVYAQQMAEMGRSLPGYKLVAKRSLRRWRDEEEAIKVLTATVGDKAFSKKLISPAQAEKLNCIDLTGLIEKPDAGLTLVEEGDKRPAVITTEAIEFLDNADLFQ